jgi:hypothetical protein
MTTDPDAIICDSLKVVHNHGAKLFNDGQPVDAFRLYQGALYVILQMMTHRPDLRIIIGDGLSEVERSSATPQLKAFRLHEVIENVRTVLRDTSPTFSGRMAKPGNL